MFKTLSVIFARSTLVNVIVCRATVVLQMLQIGILGSLLLLVSHVDQQIEAFTVQIIASNREELLLVKLRKRVDTISESFQESTVLLAIDSRRRRRFRR